MHMRLSIYILGILSLFAWTACSESDLVQLNPKEICNNRTDDDLDSFIDCEDQDCWDHQACNVHAEICDNEQDDDGDSFVDCQDLDCTASCTYLENCTNRQDDDNDDFIDCEDQDCWDHQACNVHAEICDNRRDDDGDGRIDCEDEDCLDAPDCFIPGQEICDNGSDDDGDWMADCWDPDCQNHPDCIQPDIEICDNGGDDDGDWLADCWDPDCWRDPTCSIVNNCDAVNVTGCFLPGQNCYLDRSDYLGHCVNANGTQPVGQPCQYDTDCQPSLFCNQTAHRCQRLCHLGANDECPSGTCMQAPNWNNSPYGYCLGWN